nr:hypothetical protein Iba_chr01fCG5820 [Ipomoea batatas]
MHASLPSLKWVLGKFISQLSYNQLLQNKSTKGDNFIKSHLLRRCLSPLDWEEHRRNQNLGRARLGQESDAFVRLQLHLDLGSVASLADQDQLQLQLPLWLWPPQMACQHCSSEAFDVSGFIDSFSESDSSYCFNKLLGRIPLRFMPLSVPKQNKANSQFMLASDLGECNLKDTCVNSEGPAHLPFAESSCFKEESRLRFGSGDGCFFLK